MPAKGRTINITDVSIHSAVVRAESFEKVERMGPGTYPVTDAFEATSFMKKDFFEINCIPECTGLDVFYASWDINFL